MLKQRTATSKPRLLPCLLCNAAPSFCGLFIPKDQKAAGAPKGKVRTFAYCLCSGCAAKPETPGVIDDLAMRGLALMNPDRN